MSSAPTLEAQTLETLVRDFSVDGLSWERGPGGLHVLSVRTEQCEARMFTHGAHVASWTPAGERPGLHLSPRSAFDANKAIRGGVPVCFPWFGARTDDPQPHGKPSPAHGFARTRPWRVERVATEDNGRIVVDMMLEDSEDTRALWDACFEAVLTASLGQTLQVGLRIRNRGEREFEFEEALHTYIEVGDVERVRVQGLEGTRFIDKVDAQKEKRHGREPLMLTGETDSVFHGTKSAIVVDDPALERSIRVDKSGSRTTVVWNPWLVKATTVPDIGGDAWRSFVCVEAANTGRNRVPLPPGAVHEMTTRLTVTSQKPRGDEHVR